MNKELLLGLILTILPISELRGGLPVVVNYAIKNDQSILFYFILVLILNIAIAFLIFIFLEYVHKHLLKFKFYKKTIDKYLERVWRKSHKIQQKSGLFQYLALALFVATPLPGTGAWTGTAIAWALGLDRSKSLISIALGVTAAGLLVLLASLGVLFAL